MANIKSAAKRARQAETRSARNASVVSALKSSQKKVQAAISSGKPEDAKVAYQRFSTALDKAAKRGVIHKNSADRRKSSAASSLATLKS